MAKSIAEQIVDRAGCGEAWSNHIVTTSCFRAHCGVINGSVVIGGNNVPPECIDEFVKLLTAARDVAKEKS